MKNWIFFSALLVLFIAIKFSPLSSYLLELSNKVFDSKVQEIAIKTSNEMLDLDLIGFNVPNANLAELSQDKAVFINFWGTWCPPCIAEMPSIQSLYKKYNGKITFVMLTMRDRNGELGDIKNFLEKNDYSFPTYDADSPIHESLYPNKGIPKTIIINKAGVIILEEVGTRNWDSEQIHVLLDKL